MVTHDEATKRAVKKMALVVACNLFALTLMATGRAPGAETNKTFDQRWPQQTSRPKSPSAPKPVTTPAAKQNLPISLEQSLYLIRSALLTLNDANRSGNYTVLRDLAAPDFQAKNTAADLAAIFANLRARKLDLFAVALVAPRLSSPPSLDAKKMLHLTGSFPTRPLRIDFNLLFQDVGGQWRLYDISIATPRAIAEQAKAVHPQSAKQ
jgi:hypothetical protein